ncbi:MAG: EF-hand domain-containing protein [Proteobacteria bacterium]|jgi:Ca2+-binding EF-hand superfamily protein|nr:EF-hand domain-containing protein [Pseudomonadota bacterium]
MMKPLAVLTFAALLAAPAFAQPPQTPEEREARFNAADANKDGKLDKAEFISSLPAQAQAMADQIWSSRVDADGDGYVTKEQYMALRMGPRPAGQ